jgi:L-serine deaminase
MHFDTSHHAFGLQELERHGWKIMVKCYMNSTKAREKYKAITWGSSREAKHITLGQNEEKDETDEIEKIVTRYAILFPR